MGKYSDPLKLYDAQRARFQQAKMTQRQAHDAIAEAGLEDMKELTDGSLTPSQTRGAFARGDSGERRTLTARQIKNRGIAPLPKPKGQKKATSTAKKRKKRSGSGKAKSPGLRHLIPLLPINKQSHDLHDSVSKQDVSIGSRQSFEVGPEGVEYSKYVLGPGGTVKMVARGFFAEVRKRWKARNKAWFDEYIRKERKT